LVFRLLDAENLENSHHNFIFFKEILQFCIFHKIKEFVLAEMHIISMAVFCFKTFTKSII